MRVSTLSVLLVSAAVAGCGGGSGNGPVSTPAPPAQTPTPTPPPTPNVFAPASSQSFINKNALSHARFDLQAGTTISSDAAASGLTISYDAAASTYTLAVSGAQQSFDPADASTPSPYRLDFAKFAENSDDLFAAGIFALPETKSVTIGVWQHDDFSENRQDITLSTFVYGHPTPIVEVPRTGSAAYTVSVFAALFPTGAVPRVTIGETKLNADFINAGFWLGTPLESTNLLTGETIQGGGLELRASGRITSDGHLEGNISFDNLAKTVAGGISGQFFGPNAAEVGASFWARGTDGSSFAGALSGARTGPMGINTALGNLIKSETYFSLATLGAFQGASPVDPTKLTLSLVGQQSGHISMDALGTVSKPGMQTNQIPLQLTDSDIVASPHPNFVRYETEAEIFGLSVNEHVFLDLYKPGSANTQFQLTYLSFGIRTGHIESLPPEKYMKDYFVYGMQTPNGVLAGRTGTGQYEGIVFGVGYNRATAETYDIGGTSLYNVDFSNQSISGSLVLRGTVASTSAVRLFEPLSFQGSLGAFNGTDNIALRFDNRDRGQIMSRFYGPDAEEIGSSFTANFDDTSDPSLTTSVGGISVARRKGD